MKYQITRTQFDFMEKEGFDMSHYVVEGEEQDTGEMILDSLLELQARTEKDLEAADETGKPLLEKMLKQIKRQVKMARKML